MLATADVQLDPNFVSVTMGKGIMRLKFHACTKHRTVVKQEPAYRYNKMNTLTPVLHCELPPVPNHNHTAGDADRPINKEHGLAVHPDIPFVFKCPHQKFEMIFPVILVP